MKYMGSKRRISKHILPIILRNRTLDQVYVEPFVGGGNSICQVSGIRIGSDCNQYSIEALKLIRDFPNTLPKTREEVTDQLYKDMKNSKNLGLKGYYAFQLSYGGKFFGGYRRDSKGVRDYIAEGYRSALKQSPLLKDVDLYHSDYKDLEIPKNSIIYCDPPYKGTTGYRNKFDTDMFWKWCREKTKEGHSIFVSEYTAPSDFVQVWEKEICSSLSDNTGSKKGIERLFIPKGIEKE